MVPLLEITKLFHKEMMKMSHSKEEKLQAHRIIGGIR